MNSVCRDIFRAVHEGKWISIEYRNREEQISRYWIAIYELNPRKRTLKVEGLHLGKYTTETFELIYIDSILSSSVVEGSYCPVNQSLVRDIYLNPCKYKDLFEHTVNLKILNYLETCSRMDTIPYYSDFELIRFLDRDSFHGEAYLLNEEQFCMIVKNFQYQTKEKREGRLKLQQLAMNVLSIHTPKGLYVLAYRKLQLDVKQRILRPDDEIVICTEYTLNGVKENIRKYLDAEEYELLREFEQNQELIKECIANHNRQALCVDDMPYMIGLGMDIILDLHKEYEAVIEMYQKGQVTAPIRAFFGEMVSRPIRRKAYPVVLTDRRVNLDQLLAINNAMKYPVAYIQGPLIRGSSLMMVGDPQQLNPVIQLEEMVNQKLRKRYGISDEYDYRKNSVYKTFLACDAVSDEILLHYHYRCHQKIIGFNNKKYYNEKLCIKTRSKEKDPLLYIDVKDSQSSGKNTAPAEIEEIMAYAAKNIDKSIGVITPFVNQRKMLEEAAKRAGLPNVDCGTVHAFQGDEKDIVLFSTAITNQTQTGTYEWLKNNKELINVATSRAKEKLVILSNTENLERLHQRDGEDDLYELVQYAKMNGKSEVTRKTVNSRALGVKPFSAATEEAFLKNLTHALENIWLSQNHFQIQREVGVSQIFPEHVDCSGLFQSEKFDFVVYERQNRQDFPVLAIELESREHLDEEGAKHRQRQKQELCRAFDLQMICVENSYARRYNHIKEILLDFFSVKH